MFKDFKKWSRRIMTRIRSSGCTNHHFIEGADTGYNDPRELPRPPRESISNSSQFDCSVNQSILDTSASSKTCACANCQILYEDLTECIVCTEPLQLSATSDQGIISCVKCGNVCCYKCIQKLTSCAFCRASFVTPSTYSNNFKDRIRNLPMERLLAKLRLPCRNSKFGCAEQLTIENRLEHEMLCPFTQIACPLRSYCRWEGQGTNIIQHLSEYHHINVVPANGIDMEISDIRAKSNDKSNYRHYFMCLVCFAHIFMCKVSLNAQKLKIAFQQIDGTFFNNFEKDASDKRMFSAWIEVHSKSKKIQGIFPISGKSRSDVMQFIEIPTSHLFTNAAGIDDMRICITILQSV